MPNYPYFDDPEEVTEEFRDAEGRLHCIDGPARVYDSGREEWWIDGNKLSKDAFTQHLAAYRAALIADAIADNENPPQDDGSAKAERIVDGVLIWSDAENQYHHSTQPALQWPDGLKEHFNHGKRHNARGPAKIYADGREEWWLKGLQLDARETAKLKAGITKARKVCIRKELVIPAGTVITTPKLDLS